MQRGTTLFWGKAQADAPAPSRMDPLVAHSMDVAAVATLLPRVDGRPSWIDALRGALLRAISGHHGRPPAMPDPDPGAEEVRAGCLPAAVRAFPAGAGMNRAYAWDPATDERVPRCLANRSSIRLAGSRPAT